MKKISAFTLSEILITLAIIGVVAAMVIPTLVNAANGMGYRTKFKKTLSVLTNAAVAQYGTTSYDFRDVNTSYSDDSGNPIECYNLPGGAADGPLVGLDTVGSDNIHSDLYNGSMSIFNIFYSHVEMQPSSAVHNYSVVPVEPVFSCAENVPDGASVTIVANGSEMTANIVNKFESRLYDAPGGFAMLCNGRTVENGGINQGRMFITEDGSVFTYDPSQTTCTESNPCFGYIDVNGPQPPNKVISCSSGADSYILSYGRNADKAMIRGACEVKVSDITDIYPVLFYDQIVKPASWAAKSVFWEQMKNNQTSSVTVQEPEEQGQGG